MIVGDNVLTNWHGRGVVVGFEDYSRLTLVETDTQPEHEEYRVMVKFPVAPYPHKTDVLYMWRREMVVVE